MEPTPDTKDWTWTLTRRCDDCGLAVGEIDPTEIAGWAKLAAAEWVQILNSSPAVSSRPRPDMWSPLEYGAHVRDVYLLFDARLALMLVEDEPTFDAWDQDDTAVAESYAEQDPDTVATELWAGASRFVSRWSALEAPQLERRGRRSDGAEFTVATFGQYLLHDVIHHIWDVTGQEGLDSLR